MTPEEGKRPREPYRILLVEDALDQAHLIQFILEGGGRSRVTVIQDGLRGCRFARDRDWDLVISDINLPGADGLQVMRASKESHPGTPVLATTSYSHPDYAEQALRSGADDFLLKPIERDSLLEKVRTLIEGGEAEADDATDGVEPERAPTGRTTAPRVATMETDTAPEGTTGPWDWSDDPPGAKPGHVLAIGSRPGDVESGCGGVLLAHRARGDTIAILTLIGKDGAPAERKAEAKRAGRRVGARLVSGNIVPGGGGTQMEMAGVIQGMIHAFRPEIIYTHSPHDSSKEHRMTHLATLSAAEDVPNLYGYQTETSTVEFHPSLFIDISEQLEGKLALLSEYRFLESEARKLDPAQVEVTARYWGRFSGHGRAEPFEVIRGPEPAGSVHRHPLAPEG